MSTDFNDLAHKWAKLDSVTKDKVFRQGLLKSAKYVQGVAKKNAPANDGELRRKIQTRVFKRRNSQVAEVYTAVKHAVFVEFGTGPKGLANHSGISPEVSPKYRKTPWWISGDDISEQVAEKYHFRRSVSFDGKVFYQTDGQPAKPFMYQASKSSKNKTREIFNNSVSEAIKEVF